VKKLFFYILIFSAWVGAKEMSLFNHVDLQNWEKTPFPLGGDVKVQHSCLRVEKTNGCSGVRWIGQSLPTNHYEITLEAKRISGNDFFCGLTFPVDDSFLTLIVGGWGGTVVGLSCIDWMDAAENETGSFKNFSDNRWYKIKIRVHDQLIQSWINDQKVIQVDVTDRKLSLRYEVNATKPLGLTTWKTTAAFRNIFLYQDIE